MFEYKDVGEIVRAVAVLLPLPVELIADIGGLSMLQIDSGTRGAVNAAAIDLTIEPVVWMLDVGGRTRDHRVWPWSRFQF
jgi:hypothetical protein